MSDKGPLSDRGKAAEDQWARERDREAIDKMKKKGDKCDCKDGKHVDTCAQKKKTARKDKKK